MSGDSYLRLMLDEMTRMYETDRTISIPKITIPDTAKVRKMTATEVEERWKHNWTTRGEQMTVTFPKGFLETLSKKCRSELEEAAKKFSFQRLESVYYDDPNSSYMRPHLSPFNTVRKVSQCDFFKTALIEETGFSIGEKDFVSREYLNLQAILKGLKEKAEKADKITEAVRAFAPAVLKETT